MDFPGLAAVERCQDGAEVADRPAALVVREEKSMQRERLAGGLNLPVFTAIVAVQDGTARTTGNPNVIAPATDGMKIPIRSKIGGQSQVGIGPACAADFAAQEHHTALAHGDGIFAHDLHVHHGAGTEGVDVGSGNFVASQDTQSAPGTGQGAVVLILKIHRPPTGKARSWNGLPSSTAVDGAEQSRGIFLGGIAGYETGLMIDKAHTVEAGKGVKGGLSPGQSAVFGEENDA